MTNAIIILINRAREIKKYPIITSEEKSKRTLFQSYLNKCLNEEFKKCYLEVLLKEATLEAMEEYKRISREIWKRIIKYDGRA